MESGERAAVRFVCDGEDVIDYLSGGGKFAERRQFPLPHLLLLDLKMPRCDGFDVLKWMRGRSVSRCTPVIVLSGSERSEDVARAYELGANSYLIKPCNILTLVKMVRNLNSFWSLHNQFPGG